MSESKLKIVSLQVENVKRLTAARVEPSGSTIVIGGKNGAGKSSLLDAIQMALGGGSVIPPKPVHGEEEKGEVRIDLGEYIIIRKFSADGKSKLEVCSAEGAKFKSPQALLDKMCGDLSFDPLAFTRQAPKEQAEALRLITGLDFTKLDEERTAAFEERTAVKRSAKVLKAQVDASKIHDAPAEEVSIADLAKEIAAADAQAAKITEAKAAAERAVAGITQIEGTIKELEKRIVDHRADIDELKKEHAGFVALQLDAAPDTAELKEQLDTAEETNRKVRENAERAKLVEKSAAEQEAVDALTAKIEKVDAEKCKQTAAADMPVDGIAFGSDGVTLNEVPFEQASQAEKIRASVAIGLAQNPRLRVMLIRDGSLLDEDSRELVREMAEDAGAQIWMETVGNAGDVTVLIEDGEVVGQPESANA